MHPLKKPNDDVLIVSCSRRRARSSRIVQHVYWDAVLQVDEDEEREKSTGKENEPETANEEFMKAPLLEEDGS